MHRSFRRVVTVLALAIGLVGCSGSTDADPREAASESRRPILGGKRAKAYPEAALVDLIGGGEVVGACSGAVIAPRVVLTAGHCVHGFERWHVEAPYAGAASKGTRGATFDWKEDDDGPVDPTVHDVGLVFLASEIVLDAYPQLAGSALVKGTHVRNIGRIDDGELSDIDLFVSSEVPVSPGKTEGYPFDYVAPLTIEHGDSGGPVVLPGARPHTIVAVNSGGGGELEYLSRVDLVRAWILDQIEAHGGMQACPHDPCSTGKALSEGCNPCVKQVCAGDAFCCDEEWDGLCVEEATSCAKCP
jgi:hypothetical protein